MSVKFYPSAFEITEFCLVLNDSDLDEVCGYAGINKDQMLMQSDAQVDFLEKPTGERLAVVRIKEIEGMDLASHLALIAHECVHIKQQIMNDINEKNPSKEFEAYMVQELTVCLFRDFMERSTLCGGKYA